MSDDEFDNFPDDIANNEDVDWQSILGGSSSIRNDNGGPLLRETSPNASTDYSGDNMDPALLAELDMIEGRILVNAEVNRTVDAHSSRISGSATQDLNTDHVLRHSHEGIAPLALRSSDNISRGPPAALNQDNSSGTMHETHAKQTLIPSKIPSKRPRDPSLSPGKFTGCSPNKKGKEKAEDRGTIQFVLSGFEEEMTCPICCDILVSAHVGNPCGHSFCGECGWEWTVKNKHRNCPICRTHLTRRHPMIPNIALDNLIEKYIQACASSGNQDWKPSGVRLEEWMSRKERRKACVVEREKDARHRKKTVVHVVNLDMLAGGYSAERLFLDYDDENDPTYGEDEDNDAAELIPEAIPRFQQRRTRSRR